MYRGLGYCVGGVDVTDGSSCEGGSISGGGSTLPGTSSSGGNWSNFLQGLIKQGVNLVDKIYTPPTYTVGADGSVAYRGGQTPGSATVGGTGSGAFASIPSSYIWLGVGGLALVVLIGSKKR